jgi:class 3 adenylate cyclase
MGADEGATVRDLKAHHAVILPMIGEHGGRFIDTAGEGILAEFGSVHPRCRMERLNGRDARLQSTAPFVRSDFTSLPA